MLVIMDMEWIENAEKEACPTQLSAMRVDASWDCVSRFDELIKPQDQSCQQWGHMAFAGYPSSAFLEASTVTEVIEKIDAWLLKDDVLCWWGDQPALVLNTVVRKNYGRSVHHPMKTIFPAFSRTVKDGQSTEGSPYKLARLRGIATPRIEHCSRNDVDVIQTLLKSVQMRTKPILQSNVDMEAAIKPSDQYKKQKLQKSAAQTDFFYDPKENKLHRSACVKAKRSQEIVGIVSIKEAIKRNYPPCSCCREEYWNYSWQQAQEAIRKCGYCFVYTWQSKYFHKPTCIHAKRIPYVQLRGSVYYESCIQGKKLPCGWCKPSEKDEVEPEHLYIPNGGQGIKKPKKRKAEMQFSPWATTRRLDKAEKTAYRRYEQAKKERELGSGNTDMTQQERKDFLVLTQPGNAYWAATGYKFFHIRNCPTLDKLSHLRGFSKYNDAVRAGYSPCKECKPTPKYDIKASIPIFSEERENESIGQLDQLCEAWHFTHFCEGQVYYIETPVGKWKLNTASRPVDVYHINLVKTPGNTSQYHKQHRLFISLADTFEYIRRHDHLLMREQRQRGIGLPTP